MEGGRGWTSSALEMGIRTGGEVVDSEAEDEESTDEEEEPDDDEAEEADDEAEEVDGDEDGSLHFILPVDRSLPLDAPFICADDVRLVLLTVSRVSRETERRLLEARGPLSAELSGLVEILQPMSNLLPLAGRLTHCTTSPSRSTSTPLPTSSSKPSISSLISRDELTTLLIDDKEVKRCFFSWEIVWIPSGRLRRNFDSENGPEREMRTLMAASKVESRSLPLATDETKGSVVEGRSVKFLVSDNLRPNSPHDPTRYDVGGASSRISRDSEACPRFKSGRTTRKQTE